MKGMDFFKKMGQKGGSSLFGGMKVKGPIATDKPKVAQTQTNLGTAPEPVKVNEAPQRLKPTSQKQQKIEVEPKLKDSYEGSQEQTHQEQQSRFELPPLSKPKQQKPATTYDSKTKPPSKKSSDDNQIQPVVQASENVIKSTSYEIDQHKSTSQPNRKNSEKKESASESNYAFEKKKNRDRKESNPFLNQIKKNTATMNRQIDPDQPPKPANPDLKPPKKTQKQNVLQQITNSHIKTIEFILKQKQLKQSIIQIAGNLQENRDELTQSTQKQCQCIEKEDYDQAENYQNKIQNLQKKIEEQELELEKRQDQFYKNQYAQLKQEKQQHFQSKKIIRQIKLAELQLLQESSNLKRKRAEYEENENVKIDNENKRITRLQNDIKFQSDQIAQFERKYQEDLDSRRDPLAKELAQFQNAKTKLEEEIEQLQKKLKEKKENLKEVTAKATQIKKQIKVVEQTFREQGLKLQQRKKKLNSLQTQKKEISEHVKSLEQVKISESEAINKKSEELQKQASFLTNISKEIEEKQLKFDDKLEDRKVKVDNFIHSTKLLKDFQSKHKEKKTKIKQLEFKKANIAAQANSLQQKRNSAKTKIPKLEIQQKSMVQAKNFKAANMKKTELKQTQQLIETLNKKIEQCFTKQKQTQQQITKLTNDEMEHLSEENQIRTNLAISQFKFNVSKWEELEEERIWVENYHGQGKVEFRGKYGEVLAEHLEALVEEIRYIGEEYGLDIGFLTKDKNKKDEQPSPKKKQQKEANQEKKPIKEQEKQQAPSNIQQQQNEDEAHLNESKNSPQEPELQPEPEKPVPQQDQPCSDEDKEENQYQPQQEISHGEAQYQDQDDGGYVPLQLD